MTKTLAMQTTLKRVFAKLGRLNGFVMIPTLFVLLGCQPTPWETQRISSAEQDLFLAQESWRAQRVDEAYEAVDSALAAGGLAPDQFIDANVLKLECLLELHRFEEARDLLAWLEAHAMDAPDLARFQLRLDGSKGQGRSVGAAP